MQILTNQNIHIAVTFKDTYLPNQDKYLRIQIPFQTLKKNI
jgi:hypothetical protein